MNLDTAQLGPQDGQVTAAAVAATASAATAIPYIGSGGANRYLWFQAVGTPTHVILGSSGLGNPTLTGNSLRLADGERVRWLVPVGCTHFKTIGVATGTLLIAPAAP